MKICVIGLRGLPPVIGGIETHCEQLYPRLAKAVAGLDVVLLTRRGQGAPNAALEGVTVTPTWAPATAGLETFAHSLFALLYARWMLHPDVVHLHGIGPGFFAPLARLLGFKTIVTHHARDYERPRWGAVGRFVLRIGEAATAHAAHAVICVSAALREEFLDKHPSARRRTYVIRNAGFSSAAPPKSNIMERLKITRGAYVLAVGRLEATKAFEVLIEAFKRSARHGRKLVIVGGQGDPFYAQGLDRLANDRIVFAGVRRGDVLRELYADAALFVHPSSMEGYGLVVAEALSMGAPVIASNIAQHREFGLERACYFEPGDINALADKLAAPDYAVFRSEAAAARAQDDSWDRVAREHWSVFSRVAGARGGVTTPSGLGPVGRDGRTGTSTALQRSPS